MRPFSELSPRGQAGRWRQMALAALRYYDLDVRRVRLIAHQLNVVFRVETAEPQTYGLRISHPTWRTVEDLELEVSWLRALSAETDLGTPRPYANRAGDYITMVTVVGIPEPGRCVLMSWIPGTDLIKHLSEANLYKLGILAARLHIHAAGFVPPPGMSQRQMDGIYARGEPDALFATESAALFSPASRAVFARVREHVQEAFAALYADPRGRRVIHNDLHQENVKVFQGRLRPLDFEDAIWGYPVQDIAMTFADLLVYTELRPDEYQASRRAFERGYCTLAPWPENTPGQIDTFIAGRQIWRANFVARFETPHAYLFNDRLAARFQSFLDTGVLGK
ncbi:MAG TPA: phosphotransferase [Chloroflexia bacterium]|nr:phosphotransferase [Chloroflexia bacterium]